jgi:hypothetical protein
MIERGLDAGVPAAWASGDEVYGDTPHRRAVLERRQLGYVLAISSTHRVPAAAGSQRADHLVQRIPRRAWHKLSAGRGAKDRRWYDGAHIALTASGPAGHHSLLVRRNCCNRRNRRTRLLPLLRTPTGAPCPPWSRSPEVAGPWRKPSRVQRPWPDWTNTRSAAGTPGAAGSPWPCSLTLSSPSRPPSNDKAGPGGRRNHPRRTDPAHLQRDPTPVHSPTHAAGAMPRTPTALVPLATTPPGPSPPRPLPPPSRPPAMKITTPAGVLGGTLRRVGFR